MEFQFSEVINREIWYPVTKGTFSANEIYKMLNGYYVQRGRIIYRIY